MATSGESRTAVAAVLLDLDGVVTSTATIHTRAWKEMFDEYLQHRGEREGRQYEPFDQVSDYFNYVDGKPRYDGARSFLESRGIDLPQGTPEDAADSETVCGLGNRKNEILQGLLKEQKAHVFEDALEQIRRWREHGLPLAIVSSSRNCRQILKSAGIENLFDERVDGTHVAKLGLKGKPEPDIFIEAAKRLGVEPSKCAVVEDAESGVQAGRAGNFGVVVGVARNRPAESLRKQGADIVVSKLTELEEKLQAASASKQSPEASDEKQTKPRALESVDEIMSLIGQRPLAIFLDYDGTLTPIVSRPQDALLSDSMRDVLRELTDVCTVSIISGRDRADVAKLVALDELYYAGSHGFDISGPGGLKLQQNEAQKAVDDLESAAAEIERTLGDIEGMQVERKKFAMAIHYRNVDPSHVGRIEQCVTEVAARRDNLRMRGGKMIFELQPDIEWDKGKAVSWLMEKLDLGSAMPIYIGDDLTDEDAFRELAEEGIGIRVGRADEPTAAAYLLDEVSDVEKLLREFIRRRRRPEHRVHERVSLKRHRVTDWSLLYDTWDAAHESTREALCVLGNGYICTRGALETASADEVHYPGTYLAGGYDRARSQLSGVTIENEDLVNWPNWLLTTFRIEDGEWFDISQVELLQYRVELELSGGILTRSMRFKDDQGRITRWTSRRLVSMADKHHAALEWTICPENWSGSLQIRSAIDATVANTGVKRYQDLTVQHLDVLETRQTGKDSVLLTVETRQSHVRMAQAARTRLFQRGKQLTPRTVTRRRLGMIAQDLQIEVRQDAELRMEKVVTIFTSGDHAISSPETEAAEQIERAPTFEKLLKDHTRAWSRLWHRYDMVLPGQPEVQCIVRLHVLHLLQTASAHSADRDVGIPARGWHGEAYRGHVFWDELFIFPFLNLRDSDLTRSLLMYRYRRLGQARQMAADAGYDGAMYPWQSGSNGREENQVLHLNPATGKWVPDETHLQRHVNAAIVFNFWQYYQTTQDDSFLSDYGAEVILEVARFWASLMQYNDQRDRYEIRGVVGPDEFHTRYPDSQSPGLNNNAYTNVMACWILRKAAEVLDRLPTDRARELMDSLGISEKTVKHFDKLSRKIFVPFHGDSIISQFEDYEKLEELDFDSLRRKYGDIHRLDRILPLENDTPNRYKASKQADVLMLFYLFSPAEVIKLFEHMGYEIDEQIIRRNIEYYLQRSSHGSTLSRLIHSWVLSRSDRKRSWEMFRQTLMSDVADIQGGTTSEGIHLGAMAGALDLLQRCYSGIQIRHDALWLDPCLPDELPRLRMRIQYRGHWLNLNANHENMEIAVEAGVNPPFKVIFDGKEYSFGPNDRHVFAIRNGNGGGCSS